MATIGQRDSVGAGAGVEGSSVDITANAFIGASESDIKWNRLINVKRKRSKKN